MESAAGEGVGVHHVHEGGGVVDERGVLSRHGEQEVKVVRVGGVERAGGIVNAGFIVAAGSGELLIVGVSVPHGGQQSGGVSGYAGIAASGGVVLLAAGGEGQGQRESQRQGSDFFHVCAPCRKFFEWPPRRHRIP